MGCVLYPGEFFVRRRLLFGLHKNNISMLRGATIVNIHTLLKIGVCTVFFDIILIPFYVNQIFSFIDLSVLIITVKIVTINWNINIRINPI